MYEHVGKRSGLQGAQASQAATRTLAPAPGKHTLAEQIRWDEPGRLARGSVAGDARPARPRSEGMPRLQLQDVPPSSSQVVPGRSDTDATSVEQCEQRIAAALHAPRHVFRDASGAQHTIFIRGTGGSAELVMASTVTNLMFLLEGRLTGTPEGSPQHGILRKALFTAGQINDLIDISNIILRGSLEFVDRGPDLVAPFRGVMGDEQELEQELEHSMAVQGTVDEAHPLAHNRERINIEEAMRRIGHLLSNGKLGKKEGTKTNAAIRRTWRLQVDAIIGKINRQLTTHYTELAELLVQVSPALQGGADQVARNRSYRRHLLPRTQFKYESAPGSRKTVKPVKVEAINISANRSPGTSPEDSPQIAGWEVVQQFGLAGKGPNWVRMHLVSEKLGGLGIPENLVPGPHVKNLQMERQFEDSMKALAGVDRLNSDDVVFVRVTVIHHASGKFQPSDRTIEFARKHNPEPDSADFAERIDLEAGHCQWQDGAWSPDETTAKQAPSINLELPPLYAPADDDNGQPHEAAAQIQSLNKLHSAFRLDGPACMKAVDEIVTLLALPEVRGQPVVRNMTLANAEELLKKLAELAARSEAEAKQATQYACQVAAKPSLALFEAPKSEREIEAMETDARTYRECIARSRDALGQGSEAFELGSRPMFDLGPLPSSERSSAEAIAARIEELEAELAVLRAKQRSGAISEQPSRSAPSWLRGVPSAPRPGEYAHRSPEQEGGASSSQRSSHLAPPGDAHGSKRKREIIQPEDLGKQGRYQEVAGYAPKLVGHDMAQRLRWLSRFVGTLVTHHEAVATEQNIDCLANLAALDRDSKASLLALIRPLPGDQSGSRGEDWQPETKHRRIEAPQPNGSSTDYDVGRRSDSQKIATRAQQIGGRGSEQERKARVLALLRGYSDAVDGRPLDIACMEQWVYWAGFDQPHVVIREMSWGRGGGSGRGLDM